MKSIPVLVIAIASLAPVLAQDTQPTTIVKDQRFEFALSIRAKATSFKAGSEIRIQVVQTNTSNRPISFQGRGSPEDTEVGYRTYIRDEKGRLLPETKLGRIIRTGKDEDAPPNTTVVFTSNGGVLRDLQPTESSVGEIILNRLYNLERPGVYTVQVEPRWEPGVPAPKSNIITLTITK